MSMIWRSRLVSALWIGCGMITLRLEVWRRQSRSDRCHLEETAVWPMAMGERQRCYVYNQRAISIAPWRLAVKSPAPSPRAAARVHESRVLTHRCLDLVNALPYGSTRQFIHLHSRWRTPCAHSTAVASATPPFSSRYWPSAFSP